MTLGEFGSQCVLVRVAVTKPPHDHAKTLNCRLDGKVEMLEDLIACRG
jgi:hypothetical protein